MCTPPRSTHPVRRPVLRRMAVLAVLFALGAGPVAAHANGLPAQSTYDLGNEVCAAFAPYCADLWRQGIQGGASFNYILSEVCIHVGIWDSEDAGIQCLEQGIRGALRLTDDSLVFGQFAPGERQMNVYWRDRPDHSWAEMAMAYMERIPAYCDQATPEIHNYLPCLAREVRFFQVALKRIDTQPINWQ